MEKEIPTAEEFAKNHHPMKTYPTDWNVMIEFAKLHVEKALKEASKKGMVELDSDWIRKTETIHPGQLVSSINIKLNKDSIIKSYPSENIK